MSRQYKRVYELTIYPVDGESVKISNLRLEFEIVKDIKAEPNIGGFTLYNANENTLQALQKKDTKVILNVGYENDQYLLFTGDIRNVYQTVKETDTLTVFFAGDGEVAYKNARFNKTYKESTAVKTAIEEVIKSFPGLTRGLIGNIPEVAGKIRGQTLSGSSYQVMNNLGKEYGFDWSIQDDGLTIIDDNKVNDTEAVLINSATGMINSPTLTENGVEVTTLLNPRLSPNRFFRIESIGTNVQIGNLATTELKKTKAEGDYKVMKTIFKGDSRQGQWISKVRGKLLNV